jgi:hypothetical protein
MRSMWMRAVPVAAISSNERARPQAQAFAKCGAGSCSRTKSMSLAGHAGPPPAARPVASRRVLAAPKSVAARAATAEPLPRHCRQLIVGTGAEGRLPVVPEVIEEARRRGVELLMLPTAEACARLSAADVNETAAAIHSSRPSIGMVQVVNACPTPVGRALTTSAVARLILVGCQAVRRWWEPVLLDSSE